MSSGFDVMVISSTVFYWSLCYRSIGCHQNGSMVQQAHSDVSVCMSCNEQP